MDSNRTQLRYLLALVRIPGMGPVKIQEVVDAYPDLSQMPHDPLDWEGVNRDLKWAEGEACYIIPKSDPLYPPLLKEVHGAPAVLFVKGNVKLLSRPQIAIVGSRNPSHIGKEVATQFAKHFAVAGFTVTSGLAVDIAPERTQRIQENLERLQLKATVITADATKPDTWWDGQLFDRILIDAPCSATGIIRRHPDIKYLRQPMDTQILNQQQAKLLNALWTLLKPGGLLVYTTCSVLPAENTAIMEAFLSTHANAQPKALNLPIGLSQPVGQQLLPGQNQCDGFYYAVIFKTF